MKIIFATTNKRKIEDIKLVLNELNLKDVEIISLNEIGFNDEVEENGSTLEENSMIKAKTIYDFCQKEKLNCAVLADDSGLFVEALNGEPGIYTARYADEEIKRDSNLPKHQAIYKLLNNMSGIENRNAYYKSVVTLILPDGRVLLSEGKTDGYISKTVVEPIKKPYLYSVFVDKKSNKTFILLTSEEFKGTYRDISLKNMFKQLENFMENTTSKIKEK